MKISCLCILVLLAGLGVFAQSGVLTKQIRSLEKLSVSYTRDTQLVVSYCRLAHLYQFKNVDSVATYAQKALSLSEAHDWPKGRILAFHEQSNYLVFDGRYHNVMDISRQALTLAQFTRWPLHEAHAYRFMGDCHAEFKQWDSAQVYYDKAVVIFKKLKNDSMIVRCKVNMGDLYRGKSNFRVAERYYQSALQDYYRTHSDFGIGLVNWSQGYLHVMQHELDSALAHFQKVEKIAYKLDNVFAQAAIYNEMAGLQLRRGRFSEALRLAQLALDYSRRYHSNQQIFWASFITTQAYKGLGNYKEALHFSELALNQRDSMYYETFESRLNLYKSQYEKDLALQKQANEVQNRNRQFWIMGGFLGAFIIILLYRNSLLSQRREKQDAEYQQRIAQTEISALRAQMNPHFIFNCLNSIQYYTARNEADKASEYLTKFSRLIRLVLENSRSEKVTLYNELETLRLYIEMEAMRFQQKVQSQIRVASGLDIETIQIPPLLIQPFVENAIWHGLMHKEQGGTVTIDIQQPDETLLHIEVIDDGVGRQKAAEFKSKSVTQQKSFGLKVTSERIDLINQLYQTNTRVEIIDLMNADGQAIGTKVSIDIPI
ncbi:tetratricopeptide repeat-containing sensor histidine kinase [Runella aurantiaca]|uniref:tetratricopeptide repeat-containing sensor histidine kinase n=1 Tax=Runella aurantiaca TaxID=2282308 RepID=UPI0013146941|nr:histidine kinase [Runella aurantiaca]